FPDWLAEVKRVLDSPLTAQKLGQRQTVLMIGLPGKLSEQLLGKLQLTKLLSRSGQDKLGIVRLFWQSEAGLDQFYCLVVLFLGLENLGFESQNAHIVRASHLEFSDQLLGFCQCFPILVVLEVFQQNGDVLSDVVGATRDNLE